MAVTDADHVFFLVRQSQVYTHVSKLMDFPSSHEMALSHREVGGYLRKDAHIPSFFPASITLKNGQS